MHFSILSEHNPSDDMTVFVNQYIHKLFRAYPNFKHFKLDFDAINACTGCFSCWVKTPGRCCLKDLTSELNFRLVHDDTVVLVTPIYYGCYSPSFKKLLDRSIPNILPFFKKVKGEIHHKQRYTHKAKQIILAYNSTITAEEQTTFLELVEANSINFDIDLPRVYFCQTPIELQIALNEIHYLLAKEVVGNV